MRAVLIRAALVVLGACTFADAQIRQRAAKDFACSEDEVVVHELPSGPNGRALALLALGSVGKAAANAVHIPSPRASRARNLRQLNRVAASP